MLNFWAISESGKHCLKTSDIPALELKLWWLSIVWIAHRISALSTSLSLTFLSKLDWPGDCLVTWVEDADKLDWAHLADVEFLKNGIWVHFRPSSWYLCPFCKGGSRHTLTFFPPGSMTCSQGDWANSFGNDTCPAYLWKGKEDWSEIREHCIELIVNTKQQLKLSSKQETEARKNTMCISSRRVTARCVVTGTVL